MITNRFFPPDGEPSSPSHEDLQDLIAIQRGPEPDPTDEDESGPAPRNWIGNPQPTDEADRFRDDIEHCQYILTDLFVNPFTETQVVELAQLYHTIGPNTVVQAAHIFQLLGFIDFEALIAIIDGLSVRLYNRQMGVYPQHG